MSTKKEKTVTQSLHTPDDPALDAIMGALLEHCGRQDGDRRTINANDAVEYLTLALCLLLAAIPDDVREKEIERLLDHLGELSDAVAEQQRKVRAART